MNKLNLLQHGTSEDCSHHSTGVGVPSAHDKQYPMGAILQSLWFVELVWLIFKLYIHASYSGRLSMALMFKLWFIVIPINLIVTVYPEGIWHGNQYYLWSFENLVRLIFWKKKRTIYWFWLSGLLRIQGVP